MTLLENILSWQEGFRVVTNCFEVRVIELKESQLKTFRSSSKQFLHFSETYAHGKKLPRSNSRGSPPAFYFRVLFHFSETPCCLRHDLSQPHLGPTALKAASVSMHLTVNTALLPRLVHLYNFF